MNKPRLKTTERVLLEPGYRRAYQPVETTAPVQAAQSRLATLKVGQRVQPRQVSVRRQAAPAGLSEAELIHLLQACGIGRPATYADTVQALVTHQYAARSTGGMLVMTPRGQAVCRKLIEMFPWLFDLDFTAQLEAQLDQIAAGALTYSAFLRPLAAKLGADIQQKPVQTEFEPNYGDPKHIAG